MSSPTPFLPISTPTPTPIYSVSPISDTTRRSTHSASTTGTQTEHRTNPLRRISTYLKNSVTLEDATQARLISHYGVYEDVEEEGEREKERGGRIRRWLRRMSA
jgi:hypothetical protein